MGLVNHIPPMKARDAWGISLEAQKGHPVESVKRYELNLEIWQVMICYYLFILLKLAGALEFDMETIFKFTDGELHIYIYIFKTIF